MASNGMDWRLPDIDMRLCTLCGACVELCPTRAVEMGTAGPFIARPDDCNYCTECETICPHGAIRCPYEITWGEE